MSSPALLRPAAPILPALFQAMPEGGRRFWEFFTDKIRNPHTRRAYLKAVETFAPGARIMVCTIWRP